MLKNFSLCDNTVCLWFIDGMGQSGKLYLPNKQTREAT